MVKKSTQVSAPLLKALNAIFSLERLEYLHVIAHNLKNPNSFVASLKSSSCLESGLRPLDNLFHFLPFQPIFYVLNELFYVPDERLNHCAS